MAAPGVFLLWFGLGAFLLVFFGLFAYGMWQSSAPYKGKTTSPFKGRKFYNLEPVDRRDWKMVVASLREILTNNWKNRKRKPHQPVTSYAEQEGDMVVTWVGHATVLLQIDGKNILTDPVWDEHCSPIPVDMFRRRMAPGIPMDKLPPIDYVVLSHNHYDHMSIPTLKELKKRFNPKIYCPLGCKEYLVYYDLEPTEELDWWQTVNLTEKETLTFAPARHTSGRGFLDKDSSLWGSYVFDGRAGPVYFAGDTGYTDTFEELKKRFGGFRLALLPIGAYQPREMMKEMHMNPADAVKAHRKLGSKTSVGIHHSTFPLGTDDQGEPLKDLKLALLDQEVDPETFWVLAPGESKIVS